MFHRLIPAALCFALLMVPAMAEIGSASWYGPGFHGRKTASGERFNQWAMTCAHRHLRLGTMVRVTNLDNGKVAKCKINDRGPYAHDRVLDASKAVGAALGMIHRGTAHVRVDVIR